MTVGTQLGTVRVRFFILLMPFKATVVPKDGVIDPVVPPIKGFVDRVANAIEMDPWRPAALSGEVEGEFLRQLPVKFAPELRFSLSPRRPGGENRVRRADEPVSIAAHLTLPSLRDGSLPLPLEGRRGALVTDVHAPHGYCRLSRTVASQPR
jgi:hypothetical protein